MIGFIYILYCSSNDDFYIGSTNSTIKTRWGVHKCHAKSGKKSKINRAIREYGIDNFNIEILEIVEYKNKAYLKILENKYIKYFKPTLNKNESYLTPCERLLKSRESSLRYYHNHMENSEEFKLKNRENNRRNMRNYRKNNPEIYNQYMRNYMRNRYHRKNI